MSVAPKYEDVILINSPNTNCVISTWIFPNRNVNGINSIPSNTKIESVNSSNK